GHHAWGVTTQMVDTQDLYVERVNPDDPGQYEVDGEWVDFETRTETIAVAGGDDVTFEVRSTRHGPVMSGTYLDEGGGDGSRVVALRDEDVVALAGDALTPPTIYEASLGIGRPRTYREFRAALAGWDIAAQSGIYGEIDGKVADRSPGRVPVRAGHDG